MGVNLYLKELWGSSDANTCCFTCLLSNSCPQLILEDCALPHNVHFRLPIKHTSKNFKISEGAWGGGRVNFLKVAHYLPKSRAMLEKKKKKCFQVYLQAQVDHYFQEIGPVNKAFFCFIIPTKFYLEVLSY